MGGELSETGSVGFSRGRPCGVGQNHMYMYSVYTVILARKSPDKRSHTVYIYTVLANPTNWWCCLTYAGTLMELRLRCAFKLSALSKDNVSATFIGHVL